MLFYCPGAICVLGSLSALARCDVRGQSWPVVMYVPDWPVSCNEGWRPLWACVCQLGQRWPEALLLLLLYRIALWELVAGRWVTRAVCVAGHCALQWSHSHVIQLWFACDSTGIHIWFACVLWNWVIHIQFNWDSQMICISLARTVHVNYRMAVITCNAVNIAQVLFGYISVFKKMSQNNSNFSSPLETFGLECVSVPFNSFWSTYRGVVFKMQQQYSCSAAFVLRNLRNAQARIKSSPMLKLYSESCFLEFVYALSKTLWSRFKLNSNLLLFSR